jgi:predicted acylesterase/phospholipase RssA
MSRPQSAAERQARSILAAEVIPEQALDLVAELKKELAFGLARKVLERCAQDPRFLSEPGRRVRVAQARALCTYQDPDLPAYDRLEEALRILREGDDLERTADPETLGLAGAIFKRRWETNAQKRDLELSLAYYERGFAQPQAEDYGYTGINAAYVLDLLADLESPPGAVPPGVDIAGARRERAKRIRRDIAERLEALHAADASLGTKWWFLVTLGEAYFGLDACDDADRWLRRARELARDSVAPDAPGAVPEWERESTARQLASLLLLKRRAGAQNLPRAERTLREFLGNDNALESVVRGRIGLALSGGGFRASLYHIGVLARLAELDLLRSVEFLSCVSGGSIVGAHYYLEARKLLQEKDESSITQQDYIDIVRRMERDFRLGVQRNIRTRILAEWTTNLKLMFASDYSRTKRAGELYEKELYSKVKDGGEGAKRWLDQLKVTPRDERAGFAPKQHNWRRRHKVPILVLNATSLNTGHNWQYTASWMGEPPASIDTAIDGNYRLRRLYYDEAPKGAGKMRLGEAVAASACVPGIFEPLNVSGVYRRTAEGVQVDPVVRLVDGGVHDNQGIESLLEQGCSVLLVSDASGQMTSEDVPGDGMITVPLRANSILQARVREAQYRELSARRRSGLLKGLMFIHLKNGLGVEPVDWIDCQDPSPPRSPAPLTSYGVQRRVQEALAAIRTDLDSFSDAEAYALMCDGYLMTRQALGGQELGFALAAPRPASWDFKRAEPLMAQAGADNPLLRQLKAGEKLFFKVWTLMPVLRSLGALAALCMLGALVAAVWFFGETQLVSLTLSQAILTAVGIAAPLMGLGIANRLGFLNWRKTLNHFLIGLGLATFGFIIARLHLHIFDRWFLRQGRL